MKSSHSHEYANGSQRSRSLFEEPQLLFPAINSTNNLWSVCPSFCLSVSPATNKYGNRVDAAASLTPRTHSNISNGNEKKIHNAKIIIIWVGWMFLEVFLASQDFDLSCFYSSKTNKTQLLSQNCYFICPKLQTLHIPRQIFKVRSSRVEKFSGENEA